MRQLTSNKAFWLLLAISVATIIPMLWLNDFHTKGEPREAIVAVSMLAQDNWVLPVNNGGEMPYKPPFFHWAIAGLSALFGGAVNEGLSRLPSAIALIAMVMGVFVFYRQRRDTRTALIASLVTLTAFELHRAGANCRVDMVLTAFTVGTLMLLYRWWERGMKGVPWLAIIAMGCGSLTKGPVGSVIPCLVMGVFMLMRGVGFWRALLSLAAWGAMSLLIPLLWYVAAYQQGGQAFIDLVMEENFGRMTSTMSYDSCVNPWPYNFVTLISGYLPWTLLCLITLFFLPLGRVFKSIGFAPRRWWNGVMTMNVVDLFSLVSIVVIFVFYCIPQSKRSVYLMPIYPFIAYFLARLMLWMAEFKLKPLRIYGSIIAWLGIVLTICFIVIKSGAIPDTIFHGKRAVQNASMLHAIEAIGGGRQWWQWLGVALPVAISVWWFVARRTLRPISTIYAVIAMTMGLYITLDGVYQPAALGAKSQRAVAETIDRVAPSSSGPLYEFIEASTFSAGDPIHYFELNYYLDNRIGNFWRERPAKGYLIMGQNDADKWIPEFEKEGYCFKSVYEAPMPILHQTTNLYRFKRCKCKRNH